MPAQYRADWGGGDLMRGVVSAIAPDGTYGQIAADDGRRYSYWTNEVRNGPVEVGEAVNFEMAEGQPVDIFVLPKPGPDLSPRPLEEAEPAEQPPPTGMRGYAAVALARFAAAAPILAARRVAGFSRRSSARMDSGRRLSHFDCADVGEHLHRLQTFSRRRLSRLVQPRLSRAAGGRG